MAVLKVWKEVSTLPGTLAANAIYAVRVGDGFDLYITDSTGTSAKKVNAPSSSTVPLGRWEGTNVGSLVADNIFDDALYSSYTIKGQFRPVTNAVNLVAVLRDATPADVAGGRSGALQWVVITSGSTSSNNGSWLIPNVNSSGGVKITRMDLMSEVWTLDAINHGGGGNWLGVSGGGYFGDTTPRQGIRLAFSAGNIAAGWMEIVGHLRQAP